MELRCKQSASSFFITTRVPNAIHGYQTQHMKVVLEKGCFSRLILRYFGTVVWGLY